jgi:two-component system, NarL family, response regulator LiaR
MCPQRQNSVESVMEALRILIADDHPAVRILLRNILETVPRWKVCGEAENGNSAVALATSLRPDIIVMDLVMPEINGLEATRQVLKFNQKARVILTHTA